MSDYYNKMCCKICVVFFVLQISLFYSSIQALNNAYCQICCIELQEKTVGKRCGSHTMCKYTNDIGPSCKGFINIRFTAVEKQAIVNAHNTIRNHLAGGRDIDGGPGSLPTASNMRMISWNEELAAIAQRWAGQCVYTNDICRDAIMFPVGQNIGRGILAIDGELTLIYRWADERQYFNSTLIASYKRPGFGTHSYEKYSQMIWGDTYLIGCARVIFQTIKASNVKYVQHLVCNYGPTGNIPNQRVYRIGPPCSDCQEGTTCITDYEFLCAADNIDVMDYLQEKQSKIMNDSSFLCSLPHIWFSFIIVVVLLYLR